MQISTIITTLCVFIGIGLVFYGSRVSGERNHSTDTRLTALETKVSILTEWVHELLEENKEKKQ